MTHLQAELGLSHIWPERGSHQDNMFVKYIPPYTPLLYSKTGVCRGIPFFYFLLQNIDCVYSLEPPHRGGSNL